jgi:molybdenum ABC transporter molybdate-binding protein
VKKFAIIVVLLVVGAGAFAWYQRNNARSAAAGIQLRVFCAAGIKAPVEAVAAQYQKEYGSATDLEYGGTASLLSAIRVAKAGDLFIAADDAAIDNARKLGLVREVLPLVKQKLVVAVPKGNPKSIHTLDDLCKDGIHFGLTNPESASAGRVTKRTLGSRWEAFNSKATVSKPTVMDIATDVKLGTVDAAIVWDSTVAQFPTLEAVSAPQLAGAAENASVAVLSSSSYPTAALRFARYLTAPEKGGPIFDAKGFHAVSGDQWSEKPNFILYSGGVNRPAIQQTLQEFADREGVDLTTVFNGCGVLCATMKAMEKTPGAHLPDAYYACDVCFVPPVANLYPEAVVLTQAQIMLAVPKGNPKNVKTIADLAQPGLKVGICNAEQSTLGFMTRGILKSSGLLPAVMKNVVSQVPTADFLVNQLRTGSLDATIVYNINAKPAAEFIDTIPIQHAGATAVQPYAVLAHSPNALLAHRLLDFLKSKRQRFEQAGFQWLNEPAISSKSIVLPDYLKSTDD